MPSSAAWGEAFDRLQAAAAMARASAFFRSRASASGRVPPAVEVVADGDADYRPTAGMLRLLRKIIADGQRCIDGADLHACRRRGLIDNQGAVTSDGEDLVSYYEGRAHG